MAQSYFDRAGYASEGSSLTGVFTTKGETIVKQLQQQLHDQRRKKKMGDAPTPRAMQIGGARDLVGGLGGMFGR